MAAIEVPQTLIYKGGQLNVAPVLEVENFTNWKKRFLWHIIGIEPQFENIIKNGPFIPMTAGQRKPKNQWTGDERKEYLNDLEEEYQARALLAKSKRFFKKGTQRFSSTKATNQTECHKCGKKGHFARDCWSKTLVSTYQLPFQSKPFSSPQHKPELRPTKDFEAKYNKVKAKLALLSSSASASKASMEKNKGLIAETYEWDEEEVSSDDNEMVEVKVLMTLAEENDVVSKESVRNGEWVKIYVRKVHTLLEIEDNDDIKVCLDYLCIDLNYVEEQRSNLLSKHKNLVHELNTCKEQILVLKQAKLDFLTMQHVNTKILKENKNLRSELKELKKSAQIQELMAQVHLLQSQKEEMEQAKEKAKAKVASMKAKPSYPNINQLTELLVAELKNIQWKLPIEFLNLPSQVSSVQTKLQTLDSVPSLLHKVTNTLNMFSIMVDNASGATNIHVPSAGQAAASPANGEKNTKDAGTNLKDELIDLLGKDVVTQYYTKNLLFDKYCDKILKRKKTHKITNCEVLTKKGPIIIKIYREDRFDEVISNLKVCDLHLAEWREVLQACLEKSEKEWKTIYDLVKTRVDQLTQTEQELKIDLNQPLKEQDPLNELIDLANKKRKRTSDLRDHSSLLASVAEVPSASALQVLRRLGSIFTSVYAVVQKLKKESWLELQFSLADNSKLNVRISSKEITPQLSFNHLAIPQARSNLKGKVVGGGNITHDSIIITNVEHVSGLAFNLISIEIIQQTKEKLILDEARTEQHLTEPNIESNEKYELSEELLRELRSNSYSGRVEEDVVGHIAKILKILDSIEGDEKIKKMVDERGRWKNQHLGRIDDEEGLDPLEFITWRNSKFKDNKKVDETTKRALLYSWVEVGNNKGLMDEDISSDDARDQTDSSVITKPEIKIGDEFLKILHDNSFNGMDGSDITDHIAKVLKITKWKKIPNVDKDEFRLHVLSKSLSGDAKKWWNSEGTITTWKELSKKIFHKYYPLFHTYKNKNVKSGIWEFYVHGRTNGTIDDLINYNEPCEEYNKPCKEYNEKACSDLFFKPYMDAQDGKDIYEIIDRDYSLIPIPAHCDISNPNELCQTKDFTVIWYSIGSYEEFITVGPIKISTVEKTPGSMSCIYHELFNKKDRGWTITHSN
ncbi:retrovirus-related pol polyprotein from transposon TNT 1-94 [Tanacetum coccineum]